MTDRRPPRRPGPFAVVTGAVATFGALLLILGSQPRAGGDPVLGAAPPPAPPAAVVTATPAPPEPAAAPARARTRTPQATPAPLVTRSS